MIKKEKSCPICGSTFELEIVKEVEDEFRFKKAYEQGRADEIEEIRRTIMECNFTYDVKIALDVLLDRLKERNNA